MNVHNQLSFVTLPPTHIATAWLEPVNFPESKMASTCIHYVKGVHCAAFLGNLLNHPGVCCCSYCLSFGCWVLWTVSSSKQTEHATIFIQPLLLSFYPCLCPSSLATYPLSRAIYLVKPSIKYFKRIKSMLYNFLHMHQSSYRSIHQSYLFHCVSLNNRSTSLAKHLSLCLAMYLSVICVPVYPSI